MRRIVELAAASLPWAIRDRYREEWLHDLEHAEEAGVRPGDIAWGAVRTAITADRMQAPSPAHAILQSGLRVRSAGMHGSIALMQLILLYWTGASAPPLVAAALVAAALVHSLVVVVQLHLASLLLGGALRLAAPLWLAGTVIAGAAAAQGVVGVEEAWFVPLAAAACLAASGIVAEARKPPKPELLETIRAALRRRLLATGGAIAVLTIALAALDAVVLVPLRWASSIPVEAAWAAIGANGGPASPLAAVAQLAALMLAPVAVGLIGAARWARTERGVLGWAAFGSLVALSLAWGHGTALASALAPSVTASASGIAPSASVILPLLLAALIEVAYRSNRDLAPLPPASVPLPPGPWHIVLEPTGLAEPPHPRR